MILFYLYFVSLRCFTIIFLMTCSLTNVEQFIAIASWRSLKILIMQIHDYSRKDYTIICTVINTHMTISGPRVQWVGGWARQQPCPHPLPHPRPNLISLITPAWTRPATCLIVSYLGMLHRLHAEIAHDIYAVQFEIKDFCFASKKEKRC